MRKVWVLLATREGYLGIMARGIRTHFADRGRLGYALGDDMVSSLNQVAVKMEEVLLQLDG